MAKEVAPRVWTPKSRIPPPPDWEESPTKPAKPSGDALSPVTGGILDTLGLTTRPGARTPKDVLTAPQGVAEHVAQLGVTIPAITLGGEAVGAAGLPAALGRVAASGAIGAASAALQGKVPQDVFWDAFMDSMLGVLGEVGGKAALMATGKVAGPLTRARTGYEYYTKQIDDVMERVRGRLPKGRWLTVPEIDATQKLTVNEAVAGLKRLSGESYKIAREQVKNELNRLDIFRVTGPKPYAGTIFKGLTSPERFQYAGTPTQRLAARALPFLSHPLTRATAEGAMIGFPDVQNVLAGLAAGATEAPGAILRWLRPFAAGAAEPGHAQEGVVP